MPSIHRLSPGTSAGATSGCPFCLAKSTGVPKVGETIRILGDFRAGVVGTVVPSPPLLAAELHMIVIRVDDDPPEVTQMVNTRSVLMERSPGPPVPR